MKTVQARHRPVRRRGDRRPRGARRQGPHHRRRHRPAGRDEGLHPARRRLPRGARQYQAHPRPGLRPRRRRRPCTSARSPGWKTWPPTRRSATTIRRWPRRRASTASPHIREMGTVAGNICQNNRCWYYWVPDNLFDCLRKGGNACYALTGDSRYHSIFGAARVAQTACSQACPNSIDIPTYLAEIREGDTAAAARILLRQNPLPAVTGRVCPHTCETECARGEFDEAVSIREVERFLGDQILETPGRLLQGAGAGPPASGWRSSAPARPGSPPPTTCAPPATTSPSSSACPRPAACSTTASRPTVSPARSCASRSAPSRARAWSSRSGTEVDKASVRRAAEGLRRHLRRPPAPGRRPRPASRARSACTSGTEFLRSPNLDREMARQERGDHRRRQHGHRRGPLAAARWAPSPTIYVPPHQGRDARHRRGGREGGGGGRARSSSSPRRWRAEEEGGEVELTCCRMELGDLDASGRPRPVKVEGSEFAHAVRRGHEGHRGEAGLLLPARGVRGREGQAEDRRGQPTRARAPRPACSPAATSSPARRRSPRPSTPAARRPASIDRYLMGAGAALPGEAPDGRPRPRSGLHHRPGLQRFLPAAVRPGGRARAVARASGSAASPSRRPARWTARPSRRRPTAASTAAAWRSTPPTWRPRSSPSAPRSRPRSGPSPPRTSSRWASTRSTVLDDGEMVLEVQVPAAGAGHPLGLHQVRHPQVHRLPGGQLRRGGRDVTAAW